MRDGAKDLAEEMKAQLLLALKGDSEAQRAGIEVYAVRSSGRVDFRALHVPIGRAKHPNGGGWWMPDRPMLADLLARTYTSRCTRLDRRTGVIAPVSDDWRDAIRMAFPHRFGPGSYPGVGDGWCDLLYATCLALDERREPAKFVQIKEKFGALTVYNDGSGELAHDIEWCAGHLSMLICEYCGRPGELRQGSWWRTTCDDHA